MSLTSLFRRVFKQDIKWGLGTASVEDNDGNIVTVDEVNASDVPVKDPALQSIDDNVDDVLVKMLDDIGDIEDKVDVNETRDVSNTGTSTLGNVEITDGISLGNNVASEMAEGVNPTDGVNKSQLDAVADTVITEHNDLNGLNEGDFQHLSEAEKTALTDGNETDLHSHEVNYDDLTNKPTAGDGIDLSNNEITNTKISENNIVSKLVAYTVGSEAIDPAQGEMTMSVLTDARMKVKIYPDVDGLIYNRKRDCTIRFRNENRTDLDGIVEMYILEDATYENGIYTYIALNTLWNATNDMPACAGLQQTFSIVYDNNLVTDFAKDTATITVTDPTTESISGSAETQNSVNEEVVDNIENLYDLVLGQSPAYGDLIGDPLPQAVASAETVATWSTVTQSSNTDIWEFNDTLNEILIKKAGFYTWNTQVTLTNSSNQDRYLIFSTRDKNNPGTYFYTRSILVPRNGTISQSSIQFEVPNDNTTIEIMAHGETPTGNGSTSLTLTEWNTSLTLNFVLNPEFDLTTDLIEVVDPADESPTGTATSQKGVNEDVTTSIESNKSDISNLRQTPLVYNKVVSFNENNDGEIYINGVSPGFYQFRITKNNIYNNYHKQFETLKKGAIFNVFKKFEDTLFSCELNSDVLDYTNYIEFIATFTNGVDPTLLTDEVVLAFVNDTEVIEEVTTENVTVSDPTNESGSGVAADQSAVNIENKIAIRELELNFGRVFVDGDDTGAEYLTDKLAPGDNITITEEVDGGGEKLLRIASTGGGTASELSGCFAKTDNDSGSIVQEVSDNTWEILDIGSFTTLDSVDFDTDIIWDDTNKRILNNGTTTKTVKVSFTTNISLSGEGGASIEDNLLVAVRDSAANIITSSYLRQSDATNLNDSKHFSGSYTLELTPNNWLRLECFRNLVSASSEYILIYDFTFSAVEIGNSSTTGGSGLDENVKASDTDTTAGKLIDKLAEGSNVTLTIQDQGGDEKVLITASGEVSTIVKQGVNYYNMGSDICNNDGTNGVQIVNVNSINANGTGWLMKSPNGNVLTDIPTVDYRTFAAGLSPAVALLDNTKVVKMTLRTGNCRVKDSNRNDKTGIAYVEINLFSLDNQSIVSQNHTLVGTYQLMDTFGINNVSVVGSNNTSNNYVTFDLTNLNGIVSLDSDLSYGFTISGTNDQNPPVSNEKIHMMDTAILTVLYEGEVL